MARHTHGQRFVIDLQREVGAAAQVGLFHLHQLEASHLREQLTGLLAQAQAAQCAATVVEGHLIGELCAEVIEMHLVDQKVGQFIDIGHHPLEVQVVGRVEEEFGIAFLDVVHTGRRWSHHGAVVGEVVEELVAQLFSLFEEACVIGEATAAGLLRVVLHLNARALQHLHGMEGHGREKLVDDARYKQLNFHSIVRKIPCKGTDFLLFLIKKAVFIRKWAKKRRLSKNLDRISPPLRDGRRWRDRTA